MRVYLVKGTLIILLSPKAVTMWKDRKGHYRGWRSRCRSHPNTTSSPQLFQWKKQCYAYPALGRISGLRCLPNSTCYSHRYCRSLRLHSPLYSQYQWKTSSMSINLVFEPYNVMLYYQFLPHQEQLELSSVSQQSSDDVFPFVPIFCKTLGTFSSDEPALDQLSSFSSHMMENDPTCKQSLSKKVGSHMMQYLKKSDLHCTQWGQGACVCMLLGPSSWCKYSLLEGMQSLQRVKLRPCQHSSTDSRYILPHSLGKRTQPDPHFSPLDPQSTEWHWGN